MNQIQRLMDKMFKITEAYELEESAYKDFEYMLSPYIDHMFDVLEKDKSYTIKYHIKEMGYFVRDMNQSIGSLRVNSESKLKELHSILNRVLLKKISRYHKNNGDFKNKHSIFLDNSIGQQNISFENIFLGISTKGSKYSLDITFLSDSLEKAQKYAG